MSSFNEKEKYEKIMWGLVNELEEILCNEYELKNAMRNAGFSEEDIAMYFGEE